MPFFSTDTNQCSRHFQILGTGIVLNTSWVELTCVEIWKDNNQSDRLKMLDNFNLANLPSVKLFDKDRLPSIAGIYFAVDSNNQLWY